MTGERRRRGDYRRLLAYGLRDRRRWAELTLVTLALGVIGLATPWPTKVVVDSVLGGHHVPPPFSWLPGGQTADGLLVWAVAATLLVFALSAVAECTATMLQVRVGRGLVYDLACDVYAAVQRRSMAFHTRNTVGDSLERVTGDSWCVYTVVDTLLFSPLRSAVLLVGMAVVIAQMNLLLTVVAVGVSPLLAVSSLARGGAVRRAGESRRRVQGQLKAHLQQTLSGLTVVQAFGQEERQRRRFDELARAAVEAEQRSTLAVDLNKLATGTVTTAARAAVLWLGAYEVIHGRLTVGTLLVFVAYLEVLQTQFTTFASAYAALQGVQPQIRRVAEVLQTEDPVRDGTRVVKRAHGHIRLDRVVFGYDASRPVLDHVSLEIGAGRTVAVVGPTGAGKSTVAHLLMRFYDPQEGRILLDGVDLRRLRLTSLRDQIALVSQDTFLFPVSVADNIGYGRPAATRREIVDAAVAAQADEFIRALPDGYDTVVGERGATLSGGQRQRLAIARALLKDAPILILDEPTSALDLETEHGLLDSLNALKAGRTTIVIAHRLSTIRDADSIVVLDAGLVVESGTHEDLMALHGRYAHLYELQHGVVTLPDARPPIVLPETVTDTTDVTVHG